MYMRHLESKYTYMWLRKMDQRVEELEPLAVGIDMPNKQMNDLKPVSQDGKQI